MGIWRRFPWRACRPRRHPDCACSYQTGDRSSVSQREIFSEFVYVGASLGALVPALRALFGCRPVERGTGAGTACRQRLGCGGASRSGESVALGRSYRLGATCGRACGFLRHAAHPRSRSRSRTRTRTRSCPGACHSRARRSPARACRVSSAERNPVAGCAAHAQRDIGERRSSGTAVERERRARFVGRAHLCLCCRAPGRHSGVHVARRPRQ